MKAYWSIPIFFAGSIAAQEPKPRQEEAAPIQDNSFLIEEAYNQPGGVVQHINTFALDRNGKSWSYSFTQEWPFLSQRHQVSYTVPVLRNESPFGTGLGDVALNYRYQLPLSSENVAIAPRVSLLLPTGASSKSRGAGAAGAQVNLPISAGLSRSFVTHLNAGATHTPSAKNSAGDEASTTSFNAGQSLIWLLRPAFNLMLELAWNSTDEILAGGRRERSNGLILAPGIRGALNFSSGLQVVPGIAVPIGLGPSKGERSVFFYLSLEHPFTKTAH